MHCLKSFGRIRCIWLITLLQSSRWCKVSSNRGDCRKFRHIKLSNSVIRYIFYFRQDTALRNQKVKLSKLLHGCSQRGYQLKCFICPGLIRVIQVKKPWDLQSRGSHFVSHGLCFNVFIIRQAHLLPKVPKLANFRRSLQYSRAKIEVCANFLALHCDKTMQDKEQQICTEVP